MSPIFQQALRENPVVITGMGAISAAGIAVDDLWAWAVAGESPAAWHPFTREGQSWETAVCAAPAMEPLLAGYPRAHKLDRSVQLALAAAGTALNDSNLAPGTFDSSRIGLVIGSSRGPRTQWMEALQRKTIFPSDAALSTIASMTGTLCQNLGINGPSFMVSTTCVSGATAVVLAAQQILVGAADFMLVGGADAPLNAVMIAQLQSAGVLGHHEDASRTCRPFDRTRNGLCLGEGAGFLLLESMASAQARAVQPQAKLSGWGMATASSGRVALAPRGETLAQTMRQALQLAGIEPGGVGYVNAHGTGTVMNDEAEASALDLVFGAGNCPPCSSTKPVTGHCLGATPVLEAILCVKALNRQILPPTANCPDSAYPQHDMITGGARPAVFDHALSNSVGFWGKHCSLLISCSGVGLKSWIGVENSQVCKVQSSRKRATDSLQGACW
jgi:3-oxoacyl-[acyl-carrier-protein] synthase II